MFAKVLPYFFRVLGVVTLLSAGIVGYFFGRQFMPLLAEAVETEADTFAIFLAVSTFFLGIPALLWVGWRMLHLFTFKSKWLSQLTIPIVAGLLLVYNPKPIALMDQLMTSTFVFLFLYVVVRAILSYIHKRVYTPLSHEDNRHIGTIKTKPPAYRKYFKVILFITLVVALIIGHPSDLSTTLRMLFSPIALLLGILSSYL